MQYLLTALSTIATQLIALAFPGLKGPLPNQHPTVLRAQAAAADLVAEVQSLPEGERELYARVAYVWSYYESSWLANPSGSNDDGRACGVMQIHLPELAVPGATCAKVRADRKLGYRVGLATLHHLVAKCGSMRAGLTAFSTTGQCPKKGMIIKLVADRCAIAGC
jgi:hypothetical protein